MRLLRRRPAPPRAETIRPAEPYLAAGAAEARRLGHRYVGTEHVLLVLIRNRDGGATTVLHQLGVSADAVEEELSPCIGGGLPRIDPEAPAALGIDFETMRERLEQSFGPRRARGDCRLPGYRATPEDGVRVRGRARERSSACR